MSYFFIEYYFLITTNQRKAHNHFKINEEYFTDDNISIISLFKNPLLTDNGASFFTILLCENKNVNSLIPMNAKTDLCRSLIIIPYLEISIQLFRIDLISSSPK